jgi:hypothetical protein
VVGGWIGAGFRGFVVFFCVVAGGLGARFGGVSLVKFLGRQMTPSERLRLGSRELWNLVRGLSKGVKRATTNTGILHCVQDDDIEGGEICAGYAYWKSEQQSPRGLELDWTALSAAVHTHLH